MKPAFASPMYNHYRPGCSYVSDTPSLRFRSFQSKFHYLVHLHVSSRPSSHVVLNDYLIVASHLARHNKGLMCFPPKILIISLEKFPTRHPPNGIYPSVVQMSYTPRIDIDPTCDGMTRIAVHRALNPRFAQFHLPSHVLAT